MLLDILVGLPLMAVIIAVLGMIYSVTNRWPGAFITAMGVVILLVFAFILGNTLRHGLP